MKTRLMTTCALLCFTGAAMADYIPPAPLSSVDALVNPQQDNGYGLGALIESQQQKSRGERAGKERSAAPTSISAAAAAARQAQAARRQAGVLQAEIGRLKEQLTTHEMQQKASRSENEALQAKLQTLSNQLTAGSEDEQQLVAANTALKERDAQLRVQQRQLDALGSQLTLAGDSRKQLATRTQELAALNRQMLANQKSLEDSQTQLAASQSALATLRAKPAGPLADLTTSAGKQDYVVGQSIAANLRERLQSYTTAGLTLDQNGVLAGISDGLKGSMQMKKADMDATYLQFATRLQQQVSKQVSDGEALIAKKSQGRTPVKQIDGISYFVVKKGKEIADPDAPVMLSLTETIADGRTVSQLPQLVLTVTDEMPAVVREALPLLGEGSEVQAYALAKSVYGSMPLPRGVEAFTVLVYDLKGLTPPSPKSPTSVKKR